MYSRLIKDGKCIKNAHLLDTMPKNAVSGVLVSMILRCFSIPLQFWMMRCLSVYVTLLDSLTLLFASLAGTSGLASGARF